MGLTYSTVVGAPRSEVFAWHERPGALHRLMPPWQPVRVAAEAGSLASGRAQFAVPPGLTVTARHRDYDPPRQFVDELVSPPVPWRHVHEFTQLGESATRVTDRVHTPVPARWLRAMLAYRHRQLAADLDAHGWAAGHLDGPLTVAITGSSGMVGSALAAFLTTGGHRVIRLVRRPARDEDERQWRPEAPDPDLLEGVDALVHLAGSPVAGPFTERHKRAVRESRVEPTRRLAELVGRSGGQRRPALISASGINAYGYDRGDEVLTEHSERGEGFLADVVRKWEAATSPAAEAGARVVTVRTGLVQSPRGGPLGLLYPVFAAGLGGRLGSGRQWTAWIGIDDLVEVYYRALVDTELSGPVNAVAPNPLRNTDYTRVLARVLRRPAALPVPSLAPQALLGREGARELAEVNLRVHPQRLSGQGHAFRHPELAGALGHLLGRG